MTPPKITGSAVWKGPEVDYRAQMMHRFSDDEVLGNTDKVVKAIKDELQKPFERPRIEARR